MRLAQQVHVPGSLYVPPEGEIDSWLNGAIKDAVLAYHTRVTTAIQPAAKLSFCKLNAVGTDGLYRSQSGSHEHVFADVAGAGQASVTYPNQVTIAVSLTTGYTRGPAHRGRFYLPLPAIEVLPSGVADPFRTTNLKQSTKTFIEAIADVPGLDPFNSLTPMVMSRKAGAPAHRKITGVEVGQVLDTQRRRRRSLPEAYTGVALDLGNS